MGKSLDGACNKEEDVLTTAHMSLCWWNPHDPIENTELLGQPGRQKGARIRPGLMGECTGTLNRWKGKGIDTCKQVCRSDYRGTGG